MSDQNVEVVRSLVEAWNNADYSTVAARTDPAIVVEAKLGRLVDGHYEGIAAAQEWLADFLGQLPGCPYDDQGRGHRGRSHRDLGSSTLAAAGAAASMWIWRTGRCSRFEDDAKVTG